MPPEAVVEEGLTAIEAYLKDVRAAKKAGAEIKTLQLLKVVLVGSSQAGKTRCLPATLTGVGCLFYHSCTTSLETINRFDSCCITK